MGQLLDDRQLAAAEACVDAILAAGTTSLSVEDLRAAAGISKRTFHRYFPYKAQAIRPHYAAMLSQVSTRMESYDLSSIEAWVAAWSEGVLGENPDRNLQLFRLIRQDAEFWSVFLEVVQESERAVATALKARSQTKASKDDLLAADVAAVGLVAASRLALTAAVDDGTDPTEAFAAYLRAFAHAPS